VSEQKLTPNLLLTDPTNNFFFSLAAIQASKEHAKEVGLIHFEWARVRESNDSSSQRSHLMSLLGSDYHGGGAKEPAH
jgi:ATP-dependent metalloprotease